MNDRQRLIKEVREHLANLPQGAGLVDTEAVAAQLAKRYSIAYEETVRSCYRSTCGGREPLLKLGGVMTILQLARSMDEPLIHGPALGGLSHGALAAVVGLSV